MLLSTHSRGAPSLGVAAMKWHLHTDLEHIPRAIHSAPASSCLVIPESSANILEHTLSARMIRPHDSIMPGKIEHMSVFANFISKLDHTVLVPRHTNARTLTSPELTRCFIFPFNRFRFQERPPRLLLISGTAFVPIKSHYLHHPATLTFSCLMFLYSTSLRNIQLTPGWDFS